jgi:hypothetical protein
LYKGKKDKLCEVTINIQNPSLRGSARGVSLNAFRHRGALTCESRFQKTSVQMEVGMLWVGISVRRESRKDVSS